MATKLLAKTTFEVDRVLQPLFTGGSVALDQSSRVLATTLGEDAVLTDLETGKRLALVEGDGELISALTLTPSASHLIVCSRSLSMRIYSLTVSPDHDTIETSLIRTLKTHATPVVVLVVDKTSTLVATGAADGAIKVWDLVGGYVTHTFRGPSIMVTALLFFEVAAGDDSLPKRKSKNGFRNVIAAKENGHTVVSNFRLASGSQDGKVRVWDLQKSAIIANLDSHVSNVQAIDYSPKHHTLVTGSRDKTIIWWDARTWTVRKVVPCFELVEAIGFLEDGRLTYSAGSRGHVRIWNSESGRESTVEQQSKGETEAIVSASYNAQSRLLLCVQVDHTLVLYETPSVDGLDVISGLKPLNPVRRISGTHDEIFDLALLQPDQSILALATNSEDVRLVSADLRQQTLERRAASFGQDIALLKGHKDIVLTIDIDWSGYWMATGSKDNTARLWRVDGNSNAYTPYAVFTGHAESLGAVALPKIIPAESSDEAESPLNHPPAFLLTGSQDQTIKKWEIPRQAQPSSGKGSRSLFTRKAHDKDINALDVNHSGQLFASASQDKTIKIWDCEAGEVQGILRGHRRGVWSVKFAPLSLPLILADSGTISGKGAILTASVDKTIKLWNLADYSCIRTFEGHSNSVLKVAWLNSTTDGDAAKKRAQFASAGGDGLVKVWDANLGEAECTLDNHEDRVWALAVHPKTNTIISGSGDSTVTFWKDTTSETHAAASAAAVKLIEQDQELENHIHTGSYRDAIVLALQLNHPGRLLSLFTNVTTTNTPEKDSLTGLKAVDEVLANLSDEQIFLLLLRLRDWNTNARTAPVAQRIFWALVKSYPASRLSNLSIKQARGQQSVKEVLNALKIYTERHYKRLEELVDESYLIEYTLQEMESLAPPLEEPADTMMLDASI